MNLKRGNHGNKVSELQELLRTQGYSLVVDGDYGPGTERVVRAFQKKNGLFSDGVAGAATWSKLLNHKANWLKDQEQFWETELGSAIKLDLSINEITNHVIQSINNYGGLIPILAAELSIEEAAAYAVIAVESAGSGFINGQVVIRFENHLFYKYWGKYHKQAFDRLFKYNSTGRMWTDHEFNFRDGWSKFHGNLYAEWEVFETACNLDEDAAIKSTSLGAPQLLGRLFDRIGYQSPSEMLEAFQQDERAHILGLFDFVQNDAELLTSLQEKNWYDFAYQYNGSGQAETYGKWLESRYKVAFKTINNINSSKNS